MAIPHAESGQVITVRPLGEGKIDVTLNGESRILEAGQLIYLARDVVHGVVAIEDASVLVTIALLR
jgi:quercetin dioxygenase-like cupin family protein